MITGRIDVTRDNYLYAKDDDTERLFRTALKDIVGTCLEAIETYDKHATCARKAPCGSSSTGRKKGK